MNAMMDSSVITVILATLLVELVLVARTHNVQLAGLEILYLTAGAEMEETALLDNIGLAHNAKHAIGHVLLVLVVVILNVPNVDPTSC